MIFRNDALSISLALLLHIKIGLDRVKQRACLEKIKMRVGQIRQEEAWQQRERERECNGDQLKLSWVRVSFYC